jgi:hypothetical protein
MKLVSRTSVMGIVEDDFRSNIADESHFLGSREADGMALKAFADASDLLFGGDGQPSGFPHLV